MPAAVLYVDVAWTRPLAFTEVFGAAVFFCEAFFTGVPVVTFFGRADFFMAVGFFGAAIFLAVPFFAGPFLLAAGFASADRCFGAILLAGTVFFAAAFFAGALIFAGARFFVAAVFFTEADFFAVMGLIPVAVPFEAEAPAFRIDDVPAFVTADPFAIDRPLPLDAAREDLPAAIDMDCSCTCE